MRPTQQRRCAPPHPPTSSFLSLHLLSLSHARPRSSPLSLSLSLSLSLCISLFSLTADLIERQGVPLETALALLRRVLPPTAILVGQNIGKDVEWLGLREGVDFASMVDLTGLYRVWNEQYKSFR